MSSPTPRRRPTPAVYRRRRLAVVLIALLIVGGIVALVVWQPWRMWTDAGGAPSQSPTPSAVESGSPTPSAVESGSPAPSASEAPSSTASVAPTPAASDGADAEEIEPCTTSDVTVTAVTDRSSYGTNEMPQLSIRLVNDTEFPCLINVGTAAQTFEITSGSDTWWRSTDCQEGSSDQVVQLDGGQEVASAAPIVWDRTRSAVDTCDGKRQSALPGWYNLTVAIGGIESVEPASFTLR